MVIAIRIVLSLIALYVFYWHLWAGCYFNLFGGSRLDFGCVAKMIGIFVGIPLAIALAAGYLKKSKPVFWNVFVGTFFVMTVGIWLYAQIASP